jgi:hypothetical protein
MNRHDGIFYVRAEHKKWLASEMAKSFKKDSFERVSFLLRAIWDKFKDNAMQRDALVLGGIFNENGDLASTGLELFAETAFLRHQMRDKHRENFPEPMPPMLAVLSGAIGLNGDHVSRRKRDMFPVILGAFEVCEYRRRKAPKNSRSWNIYQYQNKILVDSIVLRPSVRITLEQKKAVYALGMRPDWLVTGDLQGPEVMTLLQLMNTGYHALTTLCAPGPLEALTQIEAMCLMSNPSLGLPEIRQMIASAIPLIVFMKNYALPDHRIKITQVVELSGVESDRYVLQPLFTYDNTQGVLYPTAAGQTWAERARNRVIMG